MREFFTLYTLIAFVLGGLTWGWVTSLLGRAKSKVTG